MNNSFLAVAFILSVLALINDVSAKPRIVGGTEAPDGKYPYQAYLKYQTGYLCGASIVHKRYLLTAAHCLTGLNAGNLKVVVGTNKMNDKDGQIYQAESFVIHENYHRPNGEHGVNDIALVRVRKDITFDDKVQPVKLPFGEDHPIADNTSVTLTGWGFLKYLGTEFPETLQEIELNVLNQLKCKTDWFSFRFIIIEDSMLCTAAKRGAGVCSGDSGSPLVANGTQIGISSFGYRCAYGMPDVFTKVSTYVDWIQQFFD